MFRLLDFVAERAAVFIALPAAAAATRLESFSSPLQSSVAPSPLALQVAAVQNFGRMNQVAGASGGFDVERLLGLAQLAVERPKLAEVSPKNSDSGEYQVLELIISTFWSLPICMLIGCVAFPFHIVVRVSWGFYFSEVPWLRTIVSVESGWEATRIMSTIS